MEDFQKTENSDFLEIQFDDNGYEQVRRELEAAGNTAALLAVTGLLCAAGILLLLVYFFIVKQKRRTAIERALGMTRNQVPQVSSWKYADIYPFCCSDRRSFIRL